MCVHHWMLDSSSKGVCKICGEEKDFSQKIERLTRKEVKLINGFNDTFYLQGGSPRGFIKGINEIW